MAFTTKHRRSLAVTLALSLVSTIAGVSVAQRGRAPGPPDPRPQPQPPRQPAHFCSEPTNALRATAWPAHAKNRMATVALDARCSRHSTLRCTDSGPVRRRSEAPSECVDIELRQGASNAPYTGAGAYPLMCASCAEGLLPTEGVALCDEGSLAQARRGRVVMNLSGATIDAVEQRYQRVITARQAVITGAPAAVQRDPVALKRLLNQRSGDWGYELEWILQQIAPQIGYCEDAPFGMFAEDRGWRYADPSHRVDLRGNLSYAGEGDFNDTTMGTFTAAMGAPGSANPVGLRFALTAFYSPPRGGRPANPARLDLDGLVIALVHEMRHMGTQNLGMGNGRSIEVQNAERFLNELKDYTKMFEHPYMIGLDPASAQALRQEFNAGRNVMYGCFAHLWGSEGPNGFPGYPEDSEQQAGRALGMGMPGFGGLMLPIMGGATGRPGGAVRVVWPHLLHSSNWSSAGFSAQQCTSSGLTVRNNAITPLASPGQRCEVARWAFEDLWMRSKMVRSIAPSEEHQPWNTLAHWSLAMPFRMHRYNACWTQ
ncbi:MAG: hypothetical protein U0269_06650 [Polyangiales bacterium]